MEGFFQLLIPITIVAFIILFFRFIPVGLWISAVAAGVYVSIVNLVGMKLRGVPPSVVIRAKIMAEKAGLLVVIDKLEAHYLAGGNVFKVVSALIAAQKAGINLVFERATAIDLAGREVLEAVKMSVNPKVIDCPKEGMISAVAMNGIQLKVKARVTVRANIERLVGGAGEETVIARVGEGIISTIGSAQDHKKVLENPDTISKTVLAKGLDAGTAFEILSIDIADVDVGENIGAKLQSDQAEADKRIAQANAESKRAMAVALEQEMKAKVQEMKAKLVEAEAKIPLAMAAALQEGRLGVMDYYNLTNIKADTTMREAIAKPEICKDERDES
ncbi:flotillin-like protein FloA [bacterium]|nr:flotillin-like protein FloA [bacterium]